MSDPGPKPAASSADPEKVNRITKWLGRLGPSFWRRLWQTPLVMLVLITISFFMVRAAPGGPFSGEKALDPATQEALERHYGLDQPIAVQYFSYIGKLCTGDLGPSFVQKNRTVNELIATYLPTSLLLGILALLISLAVGIPAGVLAALRRNSFLDHQTMTAIMLGVSIPTFVIAPILQYLFNTWLGLLPIAGYEGWAHPVFLILPAVTLAAPFAARIAGLTRAGLLEVLGQDFIRTAHAKGLQPQTVLVKHALRGALLPVASFLGPAIASLLTGSLVVEKIFAIPGLGTEFVTAAFNRDYTLVLGTVIVYGVLIILCNLLADLLLALLDPRVRHA